jgi:hypothetical protein
MNPGTRGKIVPARKSYILGDFDASLIHSSNLPVPKSFNFGDQTERVIEMLDIMDKSPFFLNLMMSQYIKAHYENENVIGKELEKHKPKE